MNDETINIVLATRRSQMGTPVPMLLESFKRQAMVPQTLGFYTLYRLFHLHGLIDQSPKPEDRRKFEGELVNDIWQSDVMHGPRVMVDQKMRKTYRSAKSSNDEFLSIGKDYMQVNNSQTGMVVDTPKKKSVRECNIQNYCDLDFGKG